MANSTTTPNEAFTVPGEGQYRNDGAVEDNFVKIDEQYENTLIATAVNDTTDTIAAGTPVNLSDSATAASLVDMVPAYMTSLLHLPAHGVLIEDTAPQATGRVVRATRMKDPGFSPAWSFSPLVHLFVGEGALSTTPGVSSKNAIQLMGVGGDTSGYINLMTRAPLYPRNVQASSSEDFLPGGSSIGATWTRAFDATNNWIEQQITAGAAGTRSRIFGFYLPPGFYIPNSEDFVFARIRFKLTNIATDSGTIEVYRMWDATGTEFTPTSFPSSSATTKTELQVKGSDVYADLLTEGWVYMEVRFTATQSGDVCELEDLAHFHYFDLQSDEI